MEIPGSQLKVELPGLMRKSCEIAMGLGFQSWNFQEASCKLAEKYIVIFRYLCSGSSE